MAFVNLQIHMVDLPIADELVMEPMAASYVQEVRVQQNDHLATTVDCFFCALCFGTDYFPASDTCRHIVTGSHYFPACDQEIPGQRCRNARV